MVIHPTRSHAQQSQRGTILVICLVICVLGTIGIAGWRALLEARGLQSEASLEALKRRQVYMNSKALAYHVIEQKALSEANGTGNRTFKPKANGASAAKIAIGSAEVEQFNTAPLAVDDLKRTSKVGITPFSSYTKDAAVNLWDGYSVSGNTGDPRNDLSTYKEWQFQLRSQNPILGGDLLILNPSPQAEAESTGALITGNLFVHGRAVLWDVVGADLGNVRADQFHLGNVPKGKGVGRLRTPGGGQATLLNYPIPYQTTGYTGNKAARRGEIDIIGNTNNSHNSVLQKIENDSTSEVKEVDATQVTIENNTLPETFPNGGDDTTLISSIRSSHPNVLYPTLVANNALSSAVLNAIADKNNPKFSEARLFNIFNGQTYLPRDALTYLCTTHQNKIPNRAMELNRNKGTEIFTDGAGNGYVIIGRTTLPHTVFTNLNNLTVVGQEDAISAGAVENLPPRAIVINNTGTQSANTITFEGINSRRIYFVNGAASSTAPPTIIFTGKERFPEWHMIMELQNSGASFNTRSGSARQARIFGGMRANRTLNVIGSSRVDIRPEPNTDGYEHILPRNAWVEAYRLP